VLRLLVVNERPNITVSQDIAIVEGEITDLVVSGAKHINGIQGNLVLSRSVQLKQQQHTVIATANTYFNSSTKLP
jgi:hypothetical protein